MIKKKNIIAINGSASNNSSNIALIKLIAEIAKDTCSFSVLDDLTEFPHFKTELSENNVPEKIIAFRKAVSNADGIIISTPEYIFSIPSGLKNAIEWCVSTTVFSHKPIGIITASANGIKGHEELKLIMRTIEGNFNDETTLLIQGIKGKIDKNGDPLDEIKVELIKFVRAFEKLIEESSAIQAQK